MSYRTNLLMAYPPSYGLSTLLSDDLVQSSSLGNLYEPPIPYMNSSRLLNDDLTYNPISFDSTSYRSTVYSHLPLTSYRASPITDWHGDFLSQNPYASLTNAREYSESLGTASNTTTASSVAHPVNNNFSGSRTMFPNYQQSYNRLFSDVDRTPRMNTVWNPLRPNIPTNEDKSMSTHRSFPQLSPPFVVQKTPPPVEVPNKDITSAPPSTPPSVTKQENNIPTNATAHEFEKQQQQPQSFVDNHTQPSENKGETSADRKAAEQAWTIKIDRLHVVQEQREKEKTKPSRTLPTVSKNIDNKPKVNNSTKASDNKIRETSFRMRNGSYFDSLFDGNFLRKTSTNQQYLKSSPQRSLSMRNQPRTRLFNNPKAKIFPYIPPRKPPQYEPPTISTTTKNLLKPQQNHNDSVTPRENAHKDVDERFREALHKFRSDRAEQHQRDLNESTAKRLTYGDYVRRSTKDDLLHNAIKPSPWSDFIDLKKGHLYSLTQEEKKELYNQSRSYGERVRYRNFALHHDPKTARKQYRSKLWSIPNVELQSSDEAGIETGNDDNDHNEQEDDEKERAVDDSKSSKRSDSAVPMTNRTYTKNPSFDDMIPNQNETATVFTDRSSTIRPSEEEDDDPSDFEISRKQKQNAYFPKYDSSARTTSRTEENENASDQQSTRMKNQDTDDDLFTVQEGKTPETMGSVRYKKR